MAIDPTQHPIALFLFPRDYELTGMLVWMGPDYPMALGAMLARGFQRQQPGTRLVSLKCLKRPELVTSLFTGTLNKRIRAIFNVEALLVDPKGNPWLLEIKATCTGRMLSRPEDGILASDVDVRKADRLYPNGQALLERLYRGITFERSGLTIEWNRPLEDVLALSDPEIEVEEGTHYLNWPSEATLGGLQGMIFTSFATGQPGLNYVSICPAEATFSGKPDDGILMEWEHLTSLFGAPDEYRPGWGGRWVRGPLELLLLYKAADESGDEFQKWVTVRWTGSSGD